MNPVPVVAPVDTSPAETEALSSPAIYELLRAEGQEELDRPTRSLWWSGIAAGMGLFTSLLTESMMAHRLEGVPSGALIAEFGYCIGFLIVVFGRLQLFTEATISAVLPVIHDLSMPRVTCAIRLWGLVMIANLVGMFVASGLTLALAGDEITSALVELSRPIMSHPPLETFGLAIPAGFLIAAMVWMLPSARSSRFWVVVAITFAIGVGHFAHIIAGSGEMFILWLTGEAPILDALLTFFFPALLGNVVGGTGLFALVAYAQVRDELE